MDDGDHPYGHYPSIATIINLSVAPNPFGGAPNTLPAHKTCYLHCSNIFTILEREGRRGGEISLNRREWCVVGGLSLIGNVPLFPFFFSDAFPES